ncbi:MAG: rRNA pseudouridine synthase [Oscillospiraceae bacterium]|nr:rRNA pseudouridine synthase [Oscillospiraceae bacterium]
METRLQKIIADSGFCSRRKAEELIAKGLVKVNGHPASTGDKADPDTDIITVAGQRLNTVQKAFRYLKLYKPRGYVTSMEDSHSDKLITDLLHGINERVYPVGRLDKNSEGLIILTNDGAFANDIMHPRKHIPKTYRVTVPSKVSEETIALLTVGVEIEKGAVTQPCTINVLTAEPERTVLEFIITEGKNRQIRRMCKAVGLEVSRLKRTSVGGVKLGMLKPGEYKELTAEEMRLLRAAMGKAEPQRKGKGKRR